MELDALAEVMDRLVGTDPSDLADGDALEALHRQLTRLEYVVTRSVAEFDSWGEFAKDEALSATAWLSTRCHLPRGEARRRVALGRKLKVVPGACGAWADGEVVATHVRVLAGARNEVTKEQFDLDEEMLAGQAKTLRFEDFMRALGYWGQLADPEGTESSAEKRRATRSVWLEEGLDGMHHGSITLDPINGAIVANEIKRIEQRLFDADWKEAKERLGHEPSIGDLARTPGHRRADALVEMAVRSRSCSDSARRPEPLFTVLVDYRTFVTRICQMASGAVVAPGSLLPYLDDAIIERAIFRKEGRIEIGPKTRLFSGATRRAIELRDRQCTHPYCDIPAERCQGDHIKPFAQGGKTTLDNGRILCGPHNRMRNQRPPPEPDG